MSIRFAVRATRLGTSTPAPIHAITALEKVVPAAGNDTITNEFDRWLAELDPVVAHIVVRRGHTKYMIVDLISEIPIIVRGSANFSDASPKDNYENVLVIRGDKRVGVISWANSCACIRATPSGRQWRSMWNRGSTGAGVVLFEPAEKSTLAPVSTGRKEDAELAAYRQE